MDVTLLCPFGNEAAAADRLLGAFKPRVDDARVLALRRRVLLLWSAGGIGIDVASGRLPFEKRCVGRASDWADVESVLVRQRKELDWSLIERELKPLLGAKESPESLDKLRQLRHKIEKGA